MKISKQSWHYQLYQLMERLDIVTMYDKNDLCSYMRGLIISISIPITMILSPYTAYLFHITGVLDSHPPLVSFLVLAGLFLWTIVGLIADCLLIFVIGIHYINKYIISKIPKREKQQKEKKPNILIEYLKAKKQKICPLIEFEE